MDLQLSGKVALVCGGSKGLGRAAAGSLKREGARVAICARGEETLRLAAREIGAFGVQCDVTVDADRERCVEMVERDLGPIDVLVNNAGGPPPGGFDVHDMDAWRNAVELSFLSAVDFARRVLPGMRARRSGRIINVTSYGALEYIPGLLLSSSIRPSVLAWTRGLAREVGPDNVGVVSICQGLFRTDRLMGLLKTRAASAGITPEQAERNWLAEVPVGRMGDPAELGDLVAYLASPCAAYITGTAIAIEGGIMRRLI
ncbi:MAG: SDR family oxidoreductase [Deltaproteobacteria bacterium]|nr:SDR family oxidoreductase [Deltaproteobacteria bacterium]